MIERAFIFIFIVILTVMQSCSPEEIVPGIETTISNTFQIRIYAPSGTTSEQIIDISRVEGYNTFKNVVREYELKKVTFQLKNDNVPADMYFSGDIICKNEEGNQALTIANIPRINISTATTARKEFEVIENMHDVKKVLGWFEDPGRCNLYSDFLLLDESGNQYVISPAISGSNFEIIIRFYIKVNTGL
jgi:hypothetical protein